MKRASGAGAPTPNTQTEGPSARRFRACRASGSRFTLHPTGPRRHAMGEVLPFSQRRGPFAKGDVDITLAETPQGDVSGSYSRAVPASSESPRARAYASRSPLPVSPAPV